MVFSFLFQLFVNGLIAGAIYSLISLGFSLIYNTNKFINFSHGATVVLCTYFTYLFFHVIKLPFLLAVVLSLTITVLFGISVTKRLYNPLRKRGASNVLLLISSIAILILIENLVLLFFGANIKSYSIFENIESLKFNKITITPVEIIILILSISIFMTIYFLLKSKLGKKIQAVSDEPDLLESLGISSQKLKIFAVAIASLMAGIAGIFVGLEYKFNPTIGTNLMIKGFSGAIVGGASNFLGSIFGGFLVGILENIGAGFLPTGYKNAISFALLFLFLLFKPNGLFGRRRIKND